MRSGHGLTPDVIVIGGGIVGVAAATHLALAGRSVTLIERDGIAAAASGRNSGVVQHPFDPSLVELHLESLELYRDLDGLSIPAEPVGLLSVTRDEDAARRLAIDLEVSQPHLRPTFLAAHEVRRLEPAIAAGVAACRLDIGYPVGPAAATHAYAALALRHSVDIRLGMAASIERDDGKVAGVILDGDERLATHDVVVAAGPWTPALVDPSGAWRPIISLWGVVVPVTLEAPPSHVLEEVEISIEPGAEADDETGHAFSLVTADGASSLGSTFLTEEPAPDALLPSLVRRGSRFVPAIADAALGAPRRCARPLSLDGRPLIGAVPGIAGLWVAAGHGPWGISTGPASGRLIADVVSGVVRPPAALDPARFGPPGS